MKLQPAKSPDPNVVADAHRLASAGADVKMILFFLREKKFNKIDCIKVLRAEYAMSMVEAKEAVDHSDAWSDRFRSDMQLRETAWKALRDIAASQDPSLPKIVIEDDTTRSGRDTPKG
jgi:ribosomal protein L7/L12